MNCGRQKTSQLKGRLATKKCVEYPTTITITFKHCADYSGIAKSDKKKIMIKTSRILSIILTLIIASASWTGAKAQY